MKKILVKRWRDYKIIKDNKVIKAFEAVPREKFVLPNFDKESYQTTIKRKSLEEN